MISIVYLGSTVAYNLLCIVGSLRKSRRGTRGGEATQLKLNKSSCNYEIGAYPLGGDQ